MSMMWMWWALLGCETPVAELTSEPVEPTLDLKPEPDPEPVKWTELPNFFPKGEVAIPPVLAGFSLGMAGADARKAMDGVCDPDMTRPRDREVGEVTAVGCRLEGWERIGLTLLLKGDTLWQLDLNLPLDGAYYALPEAWGEPIDQQILATVSTPAPVWRSGELQASLTKVDDDNGVLKYAAVEAP